MLEPTMSPDEPAPKANGLPEWRDYERLQGETIDVDGVVIRSLALRIRDAEAETARWRDLYFSEHRGCMEQMKRANDLMRKVDEAERRADPLLLAYVDARPSLVKIALRLKKAAQLLTRGRNAGFADDLRESARLVDRFLRETRTS